MSCSDPIEKRCQNGIKELSEDDDSIDDEQQEKITKLLEIFPQLTRQELLGVSSDRLEACEYYKKPIKESRDAEL